MSEIKSYMSDIPEGNWEMAFGKKELEEMFEVVEQKELPFDVTIAELKEIEKKLNERTF